jgi:hypothetical protein
MGSNGGGKQQDATLQKGGSLRIPTGIRWESCPSFTTLFKAALQVASV